MNENHGAQQSLHEPIMQDDEKLCAFRLYIIDGEIRRVMHDVTVGALKFLLGAKEIRYCDYLA